MSKQNRPPGKPSFLNATAPESANTTCGTCRYFSAGQCHGAPPAVVALNQSVEYVRPKVSESDKGCGVWAGA